MLSARIVISLVFQSNRAGVSVVTCIWRFVLRRTCWRTSRLNVRICQLKACQEPVTLTRWLRSYHTCTKSIRTISDVSLNSVCVTGHFSSSKLHLQETSEWWDFEPGVQHRTCKSFWSFWLSLVLQLRWISCDRVDLCVFLCRSISWSSQVTVWEREQRLCWPCFCAAHTPHWSASRSLHQGAWWGNVTHSAQTHSVLYIYNFESFFKEPDTNFCPVLNSYLMSVVSKALADYSKQFIISVVLGKDLVPRWDLVTCSHRTQTQLDFVCICESMAIFREPVSGSFLSDFYLYSRVSCHFLKLTVFMWFL